MVFFKEWETPTPPDSSLQSALIQSPENHSWLVGSYGYAIRTSAKGVWVRAFDQNFKGWYLLKQPNQTIVPPLELSPFPDFLSLPPPFPPFSLLPFLNWLWIEVYFLNYLLYLLNKVFNIPVLKFRLSLPFTYLPSHSIIPSKYSTF